MGIVGGPIIALILERSLICVVLLLTVLSEYQITVWNRKASKTPLIIHLKIREASLHRRVDVN